MIRRRRARFYEGEFFDILRGLFPGEDRARDLIGEFEDRFSGYLGGGEAIAVPSGRNALRLILRNIGASPGDEVIIPAYTLRDLVPIITSEGFVPVFADIDPGSFNIDPLSVEKKITSRTRVILATHLFGVPCDMGALATIAGKNDIRLVEDCAHALGAAYNGKKVGTIGYASLFSFEVTKNVNSFGGGMVVTEDPELAGSVRDEVGNYLKSGTGAVLKALFCCMENAIINGPLFPFLIRLYERYSDLLSEMYIRAHSGTRVNRCRYAGFQAAVALAQLEKLDRRNSSRLSAARKMVDLLGDDVSAQKAPEESERVYYFMVVATPGRGDIVSIRKALLEEGVDAGILGEITDHCAGIFSEGNDCPVSKKVYSRALQLPLYDDMSRGEIRAVVSAVKSALGKRGDK